MRRLRFREFVELILDRSYWLEKIKAERPELCLAFFEVDLAPCFLKCLRRYDGGCCSELRKGIDYILCTVFLWFSSVLPLLVAVEGMSFVEDIKRQVAKDATKGIVAQFSKDASTHLALGIFLAVYLFCIQSLRVLWPSVIEGGLTQHDIDCPSRNDKWRILLTAIAWQA